MVGAFVILGPGYSRISLRVREGWFHHGGRNGKKSESGVAKGDVNEERRWSPKGLG